MNTNKEYTLNDSQRKALQEFYAQEEIRAHRDFVRGLVVALIGMAGLVAFFWFIMEHF